MEELIELYGRPSTYDGNVAIEQADIKTCVLGGDDRCKDADEMMSAQQILTLPLCSPFGGKLNRSHHMYLYTKTHIDHCRDSIRRVRYLEHVSPDDDISVVAHSAGAYLGSSNWKIVCGTETIAVISDLSTVRGLHPAEYDPDVISDATVILSLYPFPEVTLQEDVAVPAAVPQEPEIKQEIKTEPGYIIKDGIIKSEPPKKQNPKESDNRCQPGRHQRDLRAGR